MYLTVAISSYRLEDIKVDGIPTDGLGWLKPFPADVGDDILREELETKGVVHVRRVMPRDFVLEMRRKWVLPIEIADKRWFEYTAPSGILAPGTEPLDGIYSGLDPDQFVGPDNAGYLDEKRDEGLYYKLSAAGTVSLWAQDFANNECELLSVCVSLPLTDERPSKDGSPLTTPLDNAHYFPTTTVSRKCP
jgi:hypothetical protein